MPAHISPTSVRISAAVAFAAILAGQGIPDTGKALAAVAPPRTSLSLVIENRARLAASVVDALRRDLEERLRGNAVEITEDAPTMRVILSEGARGPVAVAQYSGRTVVVSWTPPPPSTGRARVVLEPVFSQSDPVLDWLLGPGVLLVLEPARISTYRRSGDTWTADKSVGLTYPAPMPRDARGLLSGTAESFKISTPGGSCLGSATASELKVTCGDAGTGPWVAGRNFQRDPALGDFFASASIGNGLTVTSSATSVRISGPPPAPVLNLSGLGSELAAVRSSCATSWITSGAIGEEHDALTGMTSFGTPATEPLPLHGTAREIRPSDDPAKVNVVILRNEVRIYELVRATIVCPE